MYFSNLIEMSWVRDKNVNSYPQETSKLRWPLIGEAVAERFINISINAYEQ
jgi:hypothetical protein